MKKLIYCLVFTGLVIISQPSQAQFKDWGIKYGLRGNVLFPENEFKNIGYSGADDFSFDSFKLSYLAEGFVGVELTRILELQLVAGYGSYAAKAMFSSSEKFGEYKTTIIPFNLRLKVSPLELEGWNPYLYAGGGPMYFDIKTLPNIVSKESIDKKGWVGLFPAGVGSEFALSEEVLLDFSIGGAFSTSSDLNGYRSGKNKSWDSYLNIAIGVTLTEESCSSDKDGDGLGKCLEEKIGTDPRNPDTDGDGLSDGEEYLNYTTNPLKVDTDGDGLSDGDEVLKYKTDPLKTDTDGDGLSDGDEVLKYKTDPLKTDTDGDGLSDYEEVMTYKTNPLMSDTDGGTVNDGQEVRRGTDPLNPDDDIVKIGAPIVLEGITFATGKADITPESEQVLLQALKTLQTHPDISVEIGGYTDNVGSNRSNQKLSQRRADAVKSWLVAKGISADRIKAVGYGEANPRVANDTPEHRRLNRRIEFKRIK